MRDREAVATGEGDDAGFQINGVEAVGEGCCRIEHAFARKANAYDLVILFDTGDLHHLARGAGLQVE